MATAVKVEHINPFLTSTMETFRTMVHTNIYPGKMFLVKGGMLRRDISGIIGLSGGAKGTVTLCFPRLTALKVVSEFLGEKVLAIDDTVKDAVGELTNIVAGSAKKDLDQYKINVSLPSVAIGEDQKMQGGKEVVPLAVPFASALGSFLLIVGFKSEPLARPVPPSGPTSNLLPS